MAARVVLLKDHGTNFDHTPVRMQDDDASISNMNDVIYATVVRDLIPFARDQGGAATVIAYGQTGSGKTHTQVAMQDRVVRDLCNKIGPPITVSFFENQGDRLFDLQNGRQELVLREDGEGHIQVVGLSSQEVNSEVVLHKMIQDANELRATEPTQNNPHSSRSHAVCEFRFGGGGSLRIVDLAGNERRQDVSDHSVERINEMKDINWSLGCLKECIRLQREAEIKGREGITPAPDNCQTKTDGSAGAAGSFVPYRRSKLTMLLKDCFVRREQKTVFIGHVSPMTSSGLHTKNTLLYTEELLALNEKKPSGSVIVLPEKWSKARFTKWMGLGFRV